jgi:putative glutamine amidotransferase
VLLTGGNTPVDYGGEAVEKDATDICLIDYAIKHKIPLVGVCRGMQSIVLYYGGELVRVERHSNVRHSVSFFGTEIEVNSYHDFGVTIEHTNLVQLAMSNDGVIKAVRDPLKLVFGIMWHPERERPFQVRDVELFRSWLK